MAYYGPCKSWMLPVLEGYTTGRIGMATVMSCLDVDKDTATRLLMEAGLLSFNKKRLFNEVQILALEAYRDGKINTYELALYLDVTVGNARIIALRRGYIRPKRESAAAKLLTPKTKPLIEELVRLGEKRQTGGNIGQTAG